ncbi:MAG: T9SS type A sorting domain-containing protein [Chitinophagales bacterium]|nr:T9SS type A sorting domain-containing protein [Chitinophagales bacterium]
MKHALLFFFSLCCNLAIAQTRNPAQDINRTNIWRFGDASVPGADDVPGLDFNSGTPVVINSGKHLLLTTTSAISDLNGNLQLYGSYQSIYDRTDNFLSNAGVVGDSSWIGINPCNLAVPMPKNPNLIYYFTAQVSLKYSVIDMSLNNGKGQAVVRNITLEPIPVDAKLAGVHHCNGSDVWVVGHRWDTNTFYAYLLTDTGIVSTPVITNIGPVANEQGYFQAGMIRFSPNGNKMVIVFSGSITLPYLFDFDKSTGVISNPIALQKDRSDNGVSFSPDNSKLYISTNNGLVVQYNLLAGTATDIANSRKVILNVQNSFATMQMGRDGKIYIAPSSLPNRLYLTVIHEPNKLDTLCNIQLDALYLNGAQCVSNSLMNTVQSYFYTGSSAYPCYGDTLSNVATTDSREGIVVKAYPNPFLDYTTIDISGINAHDKLEYQVFDITGRVCAAQITENDVWSGKQLHLHKARLLTGVYLLTIKTLNQIKTIKLSIL